MSITKTITWLREITPSILWNFVWWFPSFLAIVLLPFGLSFLGLIKLVGFAEPRGEQLLMLLSIFYGIGIGTITLLFVNKAGLSVNLLQKVKWLARFAIVTPLLTLLILFWIFASP